MSKLGFLRVITMAIIALFLVIPRGVSAAAPAEAAHPSKHLALMYNVEGDDIEKRYNSFVTEKLPTIGYHLTDPHRRVNDVYKKLYGKTALDILSFLPVVNDKAVKPLFNIDPRLAGFNPFNMLIYKRLSEKQYHIGHLTPTAILDIIGIDDPAVRDAYIASFEKLDKMLADEFGKDHTAFVDYKSLPEKRMINYELPFDAKYVDDFTDEFQESFEDIFAQHGYVIAGFHDFMEDEEDEGGVLSDNYDAFWTYALCHMKYSSTVFDNEGMRPDAGVFAPCTMYMFIPKGSKKLVIGMPRLENVKVALDIKDKMRADFMDRLDKEIPAILEEMGAKATQNVNPLKAVKTAAAPVAKKGAVPSGKVAAGDIPITDKRLANMFVFNEDIEAKYNQFVEKTINQIGFKLTDPHKRVNDHYKEKYGSTDLDILSFMSVANESVVKPLFNIDPRIAGFNPFNLLIYKKKSEKETYVGHLRANAILDMLSITDPKLRESYTKSMDQLDALIRKELGGKEEILEAKGYAKERMMNFEIPFEKGKDLEDVIDEIQEKFEDAFEGKDYIIAGYNNFKETEGKDTIPEYDAFWTYSLCHFKYSYTIFDKEGARPEGGLFAPCTMYMFIRKGENRVIVGMPKLINWQATLGIKDKVRTDFIARLDREIPEIMHQLGAKDIANTNPLVAIVPKEMANKERAPKAEAPVTKERPKKPEAAAAVKEAVRPAETKPVKAPTVRTERAKAAEPVTEQRKLEQSKDQHNGYKIELPTPPKPVAPLKVITVGGSDITYHPRSEEQKNRGMIFSQRRPPESGEESTTEGSEGGEEAAMPGEAVSGRVSTYLIAPFADVAQVEEKLKSAGFKVLSVTPLNKKGTLKTVTFTSEDLLTLAKKPNSGFVGVMRALVNKENNEVAITNPIYFTRAYMGDAFDAKVAKRVVTQLNKAFGSLKNSDDKLKWTLLPKYRFMEGMPYYKDMVVVGEAGSSKALLDRAKAKGKGVLFVLQIAPDTYLLGVKLGKRTSKFIKKTGYHNAFLLPYPVLIEKGVAKIMDPKYYISVNYPNLKMSNFMKIATIPDAIHNECEKFFK